MKFDIKKIKLKNNTPLIISIILHLLLVIMFAIGTWQYVTPESPKSGNTTKAIMVDINDINEIKRTISNVTKSNEKKEIIVDNQKEQLLEKIKSDEEQKLKLKNDLIQKKQQEINQEKETKAKLREEKEQQRRQKAERELQIQKEKQLKAEQEKKKKKEVDDLLGDLTSEPPKITQGVSTSDIDKYKSMVVNAISNKFINSKIYKGKGCVLKIQLTQNGTLINVSSGEGDSNLCREALSAVNKASFPKTNNEQLYNQVKSIIIDFRPN